MPPIKCLWGGILPYVSRRVQCHSVKGHPSSPAETCPPSCPLPGSPHRLRVCHGGCAEDLPALHALRGALVVLTVGVVQVGAQVLAGRGGRGRGQGRGRAGGETPSPGRGQTRAECLVASVPSAAVAPGGVCDQIHQHVLEVVLVQGHALQEVVQKLRRHRGIYPGTAGHKHVDLVHALDVAGCKPLTGFVAQCVWFCGRRETVGKWINMIGLIGCTTACGYGTNLKILPFHRGISILCECSTLFHHLSFRLFFHKRWIWLILCPLRV